MMTERQRMRRTAEERRVDVLRAATIEFATYGLHGASTVNIAERAGISQPYVLRLFSTKKQLFLETVTMGRQTIETAWAKALTQVSPEASPQQQLMALGEAFQSITGQADVLRLLLQSFSASADDEVKERCQVAMAGLFEWVRRETGAPATAVQRFFAQGMMIMVGVSIGAPEVLDELWAQAFMMQDLSEVP